jgi:hypothetical protein
MERLHEGAREDTKPSIWPESRETEFSPLTRVARSLEKAGMALMKHSGTPKIT